MGERAKSANPFNAACPGKVQYPNFDAAQANVKRLYGTVKKEGSRPFRCPHCNFYHIGGGSRKR